LGVQPMLETQELFQMLLNGNGAPTM